MAELASTGIAAEAHEGGRGQFDVVRADGTVVFSKQLLGRFPAPGEAAALLRA